MNFTRTNFIRTVTLEIDQTIKKNKKQIEFKMAWCKSGTWTAGPRDPPQSLRVEPLDHLQNLKAGPQEPLRSLKEGPLTFL